MKKILLPILIVLIAAGTIGGYFYGRSVVQKELKAKEEAYLKSQDAAKGLALKYLSAFKFGDFKEAYSHTCQEFKEKVAESKFVSSWEKTTKDLVNDGTLIQDFLVDDAVVTDDSAKIRFTEVYYNALTKEFKKPTQSQFKLVGGKWCAMPDVAVYQ